MAGPVPYLYLPGTAREALITYQKVFGGELQLSTYQEFQRTDGPGEAIAHGELGGGPVQLFAADAVEGDPSLSMTGLHFALLGTADPGTMRGWFEPLRRGPGGGSAAGAAVGRQRRPGGGPVRRALADRVPGLRPLPRPAPAVESVPHTRSRLQHPWNRSSTVSSRVQGAPPCPQ